MVRDPLFVVTGVANEASIAWAVAAHLLGQRRRCVLASLPKNLHRARQLLRRTGYEADVVPLDVTEDDSIAQLAEHVAKDGAPVAGLLHAIAYANLDDLQGATFETSRAAFLESMDISVYSLLALTRALRPYLGPGASIVALTYHGSQRSIPGYNLMGVAKAALESACRYLASELGPHGVRVNAASPGPLLTLSSSAFPDIQEDIARSAAFAPLRRATRVEDVATTVSHLLSPESAGVTGQVIYVDNGISIVGG
jgi:enoyl-[acyl-carrier protein] reductase I